MTGRAARLRRRLDRRFYRCLHGLYRLLFPAPAAGRPVDPHAVRRILVVRADRIGDYVVTTPLLEYLGQKAPDAELDLLASPASAALARADPRVHHVFEFPASLSARTRVLAALRRRRYDVVFSPMYGRGMREGLIASLVAPRRALRVSVMRPKRYQGFFTHVVRVPRSMTHMTQHVLQLGRGAFGESPRADDETCFPMRLALDDDARARADAFVHDHALSRFVPVNLSAAEWWREWRPDLCAELLHRLLARHPDLVFVLTPPPGKTAPAERVVAACDDRRVIVFPPATRALDLAALIARATLVVTVDTALIHFASAAGTPVLGLYSPRTVDTQRWLPRGVPYRAVVAARGAAVTEIPIDDVERAFEELLAEIGSPAMG